MKPILLYLVDRPFHHLSYVEFPVTYQTYLALQTLRVVGKGSRLDETQGGLAHLQPAEVTIGEVLDGFEGGKAYLALATWVLADFWGRLADWEDCIVFVEGELATAHYKVLAVL